jgi:large subunit ribosomal protein L25
MHVPLHFIGDDGCPGVKLEGGQISHLMIEVEITCYPKDIPEFIEVDMSEMNIGDSVHLTELKLPEGVTLTALTHGEGHDQQVANCHATKVVEEEPIVDDAAAAADDEPADDSEE